MKKDSLKKGNKNLPSDKQKTEHNQKLKNQAPLPLNQGFITSYRKVAIFLFILVFSVFGNSISNKYSFDDDFVTYNNPLIKKGFKAIPEIFTTHYANTSKQNYEYRPIVKLSYALEYAFFKESPHISHFFNVLFYFILCLILFVVLSKLLVNLHPLIPLLTVILFAVHPIHTEVVASLKNRDEIFCFIGGLLSIYSFLKFAASKKWWWIIAGAISLIFAYYSKSSAIVYIAVIPLTLYFFTDLKFRNLLIILAGILILVFLLKLLPKTFLSGSDREILFFENPLYYQKGLALRLGTAFVVLLFYLKMLVFPHPLLFYYGYNEIPISTPFHLIPIISILIFGVLIFFAIKLFRRKHVLSFAILYFFINISLYLNIIKPPPGIVAERFLFTPSLGFCLAMVVLIFLLFRIDIQKKNSSIKSFSKPLWIIGLLILPLSVRSIVRNADWKDFETLYKNDIKYLEHSAKANSIYASMLYEKTFRSKDKKIAYNSANEARSYYEKALDIYPEYTTCWNNLGVLEFKFFGHTKKAIYCWKKAIQYDTAYTEAFFNLANAFEQNQRTDSAEYYYLKTLKIKEDFSASYTKLGGIYFSQGNLQKAIDMNTRLMRVNPTSDEPYINIGNYYLLLKDTLNAIAMWEKAIEKQPANQSLNNNLARYFNHIGDIKKAAYYNDLANRKPKPVK